MTLRSFRQCNSCGSPLVVLPQDHCCIICGKDLSAEPTRPGSPIPVEKVLVDIGNSMSAADLMKKYRISERGLKSLGGKLVAGGHISSEEWATWLNGRDPKSSEISTRQPEGIRGEPPHWFRRTIMRIFRLDSVDGSLVPGETVLRRARLHRRILFLPVLVVIVGTILFLPLGIVSLGWLIVCYLSYEFSEIAVTSNRFIVKIGFIRRHSFEFLRPTIDDIRLSQGPIDKLLGSQTVVVKLVGGNEYKFKDLTKPTGGDINLLS